MLQPKDRSMTWLCGLYRIEEGLPVFVILTKEPGEEIRFIHDRMPIILLGELTEKWIDPEGLMAYAVTDMMFEKV